MAAHLHQLIFNDTISFEERAIAVFKHQFEHVEPFRVFSQTYGTTPDNLSSIRDIPLYPIEAFKYVKILSDLIPQPAFTFKSSGTSGMEQSVHLVGDESVYRRAILDHFTQYFDLKNAILLAYLPGYSENPFSSLIHMLEILLDENKHPQSQFLKLGEPLQSDFLNEVIAGDEHQQIILFGAAFGLLDLIELGSSHLPANSVIIETGGMKTHRRERTREELHRELATGFGIQRDQICSEYGMAELLSQSYMIHDDELFIPPHWMRVVATDPADPTRILPGGQNGRLGIIDLANVNSCSFLLTNDQGRVEEDGLFTVDGRMPGAVMRGCNFLIDRD